MSIGDGLERESIPDVSRGPKRAARFAERRERFDGRHRAPRPTWPFSMRMTASASVAVIVPRGRTMPGAGTD